MRKIKKIYDNQSNKVIDLSGIIWIISLKSIILANK